MRNRVFLVLDVVLLAVVVFVAFSANFEGLGWWAQYERAAWSFIALALPMEIALFYKVGVYRRLWRYASVSDLEILLVAFLLGVFTTFVVGMLAVPAIQPTASHIPVSVLLSVSVLTGGAISLPRLLTRVAARRARTVRAVSDRRARQRRPDEHTRVLVAGAGDAGGMVARELLDNPHLGLIPVGFLDDDPKKLRHQLHGVPVLGPITKLGDLVRAYSVSEVIIALPSAGGRVIRDIVRQSAAAGVRNRTVPGLSEILASGSRGVNALRPISIEDLLRRDPIKTNIGQVAGLVTGKTVLVTGAGGSIGSELCRQLARLAPECIVALGRGENSIFELVQELRTSHPALSVKPAIVDVRDEIRLRAVFAEMRPYSVFHAAAHKHVPLMEVSVDEAILNNVLGTRNVAELSAEFGVEHLVLISTDKAVRPTSVMGATKRIAEETLGCVAQRTGKKYVAVRFGNVLGSRGSVVPTFLKQIAAGGPVTVTHPEMRRYFMTIPEAVQLVLQAAALGKGGEVFVLDMGDPVKIADLAEDLIRLSGLEVGEDIDIQYSGMRPGEKLYEELFFGEKDATPTSHPKILQARDANPSVEVDARVRALIAAAHRSAPFGELLKLMRGLVPEYAHPSFQVVDGNGVRRSKPVLVEEAAGSAPLVANAKANGRYGKQIRA